MDKALAGIKVLDFTNVLAGPFCTSNLSDLGAEVIKIERPGTGDGSRIFGPFINDQSGYYIFANRGKKGIDLNFKSDKAKEIVYELVKKVDVVVENFKPGVMEKLGFSYEELDKYILEGVGKKETVGKTSEGEEEDSSESGKDRIRHKLGV